MFKIIKDALETPKIYTQTETAFWNDDHISKQMLKAHLDPEVEGASRKLKFIEKSVEWISEVVPSEKYLSLLDVGCGPGIYAERFTHQGYYVTGIDFSIRSIKYAKESARKKNLPIIYHYEDYLMIKLNKEYDFAVMIYCDYGALSSLNRKVLLNKIYQHLKDGGKFLFDVFSMWKYNDFQEKQTWKSYHEGGFWREEGYIALNKCLEYPNNVTLEQTVIISKNQLSTYYLWNTYFTVEALIKEVEDAGFKVCKIISDVAGNEYTKDSLMIAILLEK